MWGIWLGRVGLCGMIVLIVCCFCERGKGGIVGGRCGLLFSDGLLKWIKWGDVDVEGCWVRVGVVWVGGVVVVVVVVVGWRVWGVEGLVGVVGGVVGVGVVVEGKVGVVVIGGNVLVWVV